MDFYSSKTPNPHKLIKGIFYLLLLASSVVAILFLTLNIHQTAKAKNGEIISENTAVQYLAPYDAEIQEVFVQEGDQVSKGDTLIILYNEKLWNNFHKTKSSLSSSIKNINIHQRQLTNYEEKINRQKAEIAILKTKHKNRKKGKVYEAKNIEERLKVLEDKLNISKVAIQKNRQLYQKGAISEKEYNRRYQDYLDESNMLTKLKNEAYQQHNRSDNIETELAEGLSRQELNILKAESEHLERQKFLEEEEAKKEHLETKLSSDKKELEKLIIIADLDGYASKLFNIQKEVNLVLKKQALLYVTPLSEEKFYANFRIDEKEIKDIQIGQKVHIKFDAYNHYQYGVLKGTVTHINKEIGGKKDKAQSGLFYVLADIPKEEAEKIDIRGGFKVNGEIIIKKVKLYQYFFESMFQKK